MPNKPLLILGIGAGIAAYKAIPVVRLATKAGWEVQVIPTPTALEMVGRKTWEALSGRPVLVDTFADDQGGVTHIELAREAAAVLIVPATADLMARMSHGLANDLLTNILLATTAPVFIAPAMHTQMWQHPATRSNVETLLRRGVTVIGPAQGALSSGDHGWGRLVEPEEIWETFCAAFPTSDKNTELSQTYPVPDTETKLSDTETKPWVGKKIIISAGGTREPIDPVRFLGNRSSGLFGCALAEAFAAAGAEVVLLAANVAVDILPKAENITIEETPTAEALLTAAQNHFSTADGIIMAAAVADFRPLTFTTEKIKKEPTQTEYLLHLTKNPDILATLAATKKPNQLVVGFAAETGTWEQVLAYGKAKAARKKADLILVNQVGVDTGFGDVATRVLAIDKTGKQQAQWVGEKTVLAPEICQFLRSYCFEHLGH